IRHIAQIGFLPRRTVDNDGLQTLTTHLHEQPLAPFLCKHDDFLLPNGWRAVYPHLYGLITSASPSSSSRATSAFRRSRIPRLLSEPLSVISPASNEGGSASTNARAITREDPVTTSFVRMSASRSSAR